MTQLYALIDDRGAGHNVAASRSRVQCADSMQSLALREIISIRKSLTSAVHKHVDV